MDVMFLFFLVCWLAWPLGRFITFHLWQIFPGGIVDIYRYFKYRRWNECTAFGRIICYTGLFGQGKTKECVRFLTDQYRRYHGLTVFDDYTGKYVQQKVVIYSNVQLTVPYIELTSLQQLVECQQSPPGVVNLFLIDEASVVFNSRDFKNNFSIPALNTILTSRHHKIGIYLTSQRFGHMDALLRQVTSYVYECKYYKFIRTQQVKVYDAWDCENCTNLMLLKPLRVRFSYTSDKVYANYNTYAMVQDISKKCVEKGFADDSEVLQRQGAAYSDPRFVKKRTKRLRKRMRN